MAIMGKVAPEDVGVELEKALAACGEFLSKMRTLKEDLDARQGVVSTVDDAQSIRVAADAYLAEQSAKADAALQASALAAQEAEEHRSAAKSLLEAAAVQATQTENAWKSLQEDVATANAQIEQRKVDLAVREAALEAQEAAMRTSQKEVVDLKAKLTARLAALAVA